MNQLYLPLALYLPLELYDLKFPSVNVNNPLMNLTTPQIVGVA